MVAVSLFFRVPGIEVVSTWQEHSREIGVSDRDIEDLAQRIDGKPLLSQRLGFDADKFRSGPSKNNWPAPSSASAHDRGRVACRLAPKPRACGRWATIMDAHMGVIG